jgi:hypothetical protein
MPEVIRTSWKARANRLEVKLTHALRRAEWAEKEAKAAKYDLAQAQAENARLKGQLKTQPQAMLFER